MRIPKFVVLSSAVILGTIGSLQAQRDDSDLQAKAREELRRKMAELDSTPAATVPAPAPMAPVKTAAPTAASPPPMTATPPPPTAAPAVVSAPPPPVVKAPPPPVVADTPPPVLAQTAPPSQPQIVVQPPNPGREKAEQLLRLKMAELDAQQAPSPPPKPVAVQRPEKPAPRPVAPPVAAPVATPPASDDAKAKAEAEEVARTEARLKAKADAKAKREAEARAKQDAKAKPQPTPFPVVSEPPHVTTPPMVPAGMTSKEQKLDALLQQYRADQITPQQYHEQRAKILAEP